MFSHQYRYYFILFLAGYSLLNTLMAEVFVHYPIAISNLELSLIFLLLTLGIWEANRLWDNYLQTKKFINLGSKLFSVFGGSILFTIFITFAIGISAAYLTMPFEALTLLLPMKLLMMFAFRINLFLNVLNVIYWHVNQLEKTQIEAEKFKEISIQAQLQAVRNQVNPHFLFNNLSVLTALIALDTNASVDFVQQFSKVYRYVLKSHEKELIKLDTELDFIDSYLYLLKKRFGESLKISVQIAEEVRQHYIIPMALQMLVENAVKHNVISKNKPLQINIFTENDQLLIVKNNLQPKEVDDIESLQFGLVNISQRYEFLTQKPIIIQEDHAYFTVKLPIVKLASNDKLLVNIH